MKKLFVILLLILSLLTATALAEPEQSFTREELLTFADQLRSAALEAQPLNAPLSEDDLTEDGYALIYDFATLYADRPEMTTETAVSALLISAEEVAGPRGAVVDMRVSELLALLPATNPDLDGSRDYAVLYLEEGDGGAFRYGDVLRDGQRVQIIECVSVDPAGDGAFTRTIVQFEVQSDMVSAIRITGLAGDDLLDQELRDETWADLSAMTGVSGYTRVPTSLNGTDLTPFSEADLTFSGIRYATLKPEDLTGLPEDVVIDNEDGTYLRVVDGEGYSAVFACDAQGHNGVLISFTLLSDELEGPRCVRLGDQFHEDFNRFRNGEGETDGTTELLYGEDGTAPYGKAFYVDSDGMSLRYVTRLTDGREVELYLHYVQNELTEIILHTL